MTAQLTARDLSLMELLAEYGCVSAERIKAQFWNENPKSRAHYRRIGVLKREGLIETVLGDGQCSIGYQLSARGRRKFVMMAKANDIPIGRRSYKTQFEHDQLLIDVRRIFQKSPIVKSFRSETDLKRTLSKTQANLGNWENAPSIPDAAFDFVVPGQKLRVAIELELSLKSRRRYRKVFGNHLLSSDWDLVFYIVKDDALGRSLKRFLDETKKQDARVWVAKKINGIYFCTLEKFLADGLAVKFSSEKREICFAEIAKNFGLA